ncbi:MAG TPA: hypothetical protein VHG71_11650 [Verrucomicrobiae bacterium]|nr:hypothetical protein [Verrucomicrobiae bacterium]
MRDLKRALIWIVCFVWMPAVSAFAQAGDLPRISAVDATNYMDQEVVVTDKVVQVAVRPTVWLLNLNQRYPDSPLTCVIRNKDTNNFPALEHYLGRRVEVTGQVVNYDGRPEMVLTSPDQIKIVTANATAKAASAATGAQTKTQSAAQPTSVVPAPLPTAEKPDLVNWWMASSIVAGVVLAGLLFFVLRQRKASPQPATPSASALTPTKSEMPANPASVEEWKQRALVAEAMAGKQGQMLREKIMPELTEFAKQSLVQGLYAQRNALIETQQKAQQALTEMESRLAAMQLPLAERIRAYEKRIAELEKEVESQGEEVRELTRATLALVRRKLEDERELQRAQNRFN